VGEEEWTDEKEQWTDRGAASLTARPARCFDKLEDAISLGVLGLQILTIRKLRTGRSV